MDAASAELHERELLGSWLHGLSRHTRRGYESSWRRFRAFTGAELGVPFHLGLVTLRLVQRFDDSLKAAGLRPGSRATMLSAIKSFLEFASIHVAATLRLPTQIETLHERILDEEEVGRLIAQCKPGRDRLIVQTLYGCGLRVSELCSLEWRDLRPRGDGGQITVLGKGDKVRTVLMPAGLYDDLTRYAAIGGDSGLVFDLSPSQINRNIRAAAIAAGIGKPVSAHWLRHCHASHALDHGAPISLVKNTLGHSSIQTTDRYTHARPQQSSGSFLPMNRL
jgi:integrase/recombinase XerD